MTIEMLDVFERVYEKMLYKVDKTLKANNVSINDYTRSMKDAAAHLEVFVDITGYDSCMPFLEWSVLQDDIFIDVTGYQEEWENIEFTDDMYEKLMARSFDLVAKDDFLSEQLGVDNYIDIIENANMLIFQGLVQYEDVSKEAGDRVCRAIAEFLGIESRNI